MTYPNSSKISRIYNSLVIERSDLNDALFYTNESSGISSSNANVYEIPAQALDKLVLEKIDLINAKKQQIVTILTNNFNSRTCGIGSSAADLVSSIVVNNSIETFTYGSATFDYTFDDGTNNSDPGEGKLRFNETGIGTATYLYINKIDDDSINITNFINNVDNVSIVGNGDTATFSIVGVTTEYTNYFEIPVSHVSGVSTSFSNGLDIIVNFGCDVSCGTGVSAIVREDILYAWVNPDLESYNISSSFPQEPTTYTKVTLSNIGIGKSSLFFNDQFDPQNLMNSSALIGYYYPIKDTDPSCVSTKNQVTTIENEIITIRNEINSLILPINILKNKKVDEQLNAFYEYKGSEDTRQRVAGITSVLNVLDQYQTDIIDYENTLISKNDYLIMKSNYTYG